LESDGAYVFVIRGGDAVKILAKKLQLNPASYRDRVWGFWERVGKQPASGGEAAKAAQSELAAEGLELFDLLFPGEIGEVVRKSKRLIISPDGPLWQLPFAAMVTNVDANGTPHYLAERVSISYAPSLALYAQTNKEARPLHHGQRPEAVVVGDPDFDRKVELDPNDPEAERLWAGLYPPGSRPERLKATAREAALIGQLYESDPLTGENATEAELRKRIERADVIHLATHGSFQLARPMSSGIMLAPPAKEPSIGDTNNDGALQAWEIFSQLNLRAELVVLSACETARGGVVRGEGIVGLTRALQYAGAKSIVATQWKVSGGDSTAELMVEFHKNLREAKAKDEALKDAMAVVRKEHPQPFFWAPFILLGDPDNPNLGRN
jgi:CHAT domain-containing protein